MKTNLKTMLLSALAVAAFLTPAAAQFAPTPSTNVVRQTYRASITGLVTSATATDFFTLTGSATKVVQVTRAECSGTSATGAISDVAAVKRSTANSAGTSTTPAAVPLDSRNSAATAVARAYTVNPTLGTAVGTITSVKMSVPTAATVGGDLSRTVLTSYAPPAQPVTLVGATQVFAVNGNGAALGAGAASISCTVEWTEF